MAKRVYNIHLLIETDQESDTLTEQVREWASNEEAFSGSVLLDISQIREAHVDLDTLSATIERFGRRQEDIVNALGTATTIAEQHTAILEKVASALTSLVKDAETTETSTDADDGVWRWGKETSTEAEELAEDETPNKAEELAEDETAADEEAKDETPNEL